MQLLPGSGASIFHLARAGGQLLPVLSCTAWGFSCPAGRPAGGGLLPRLFTRSGTCLNKCWWFVFCDTFRRLRLAPKAPACSTRHAALWCSDFPLPQAFARSSDHLPSGGGNVIAAAKTASLTNRSRIELRTQSS